MDDIISMNRCYTIIRAEKLCFVDIFNVEVLQLHDKTIDVANVERNPVFGHELSK